MTNFRNCSSSSSSSSLLSFSFFILFFCLCVLSFGPRPSQGKLLIGVFDAQNGHGMTQSLAMDKWQGKPNAVQTVFTTFDESEMTWLWTGVQSIWEAGHKIPMITWEPKYWQQWSPTDITRRVASGAMDPYLLSWGQALKTYLAGPDRVLGTSDDRRAFLRFAHEMNGNWYPWSAVKGQTSPSDYVNMWKHVYQLFGREGLLPRELVSNSLLWVWSPIDFDVGDFKMDDYYPGDSFVDWVGITGFNWGTAEGWSGWWSPTQLFKDAIERVRTIGGGQKPVAITEYSSVPNGGDKNQWLNEFFDLLLKNDVRMACYFNLDKFEQSGMKYWSIFGGGGDSHFWDASSSVDYQGWTAYKTNINNQNILGSDYNNPRVLTDAQFKGVLEVPSQKPQKPQMFAVRDATAVDEDEGEPLTSISESNDQPALETETENETETDENESENENDSADTSSLDVAVASSQENQNENNNQRRVPSKAPISKPKSQKLLAVFNDEFASRYDFLSWGSVNTITDPKFKPAAGSPLTVPEGRSFLKVHSNEWGGCGVFTRASTSVNISGFKTLKFNIANTKDVIVQLQDVHGITWSRVVKGGKDMSWRTISLPLGPDSKSTDNSRFDGTKVTGLFLATTHSASDFYVDSVIYQK